MHLAEMKVSPYRRGSVRPGPWKRFRRGSLRALQAGLEFTGLASLYVRLGRVAGATILSYHSVAEERDASWLDPRFHLSPDRFERQATFLARHRRPISLSALVEALEGGRDLPPRSVVVTLDDGYLDHRTVAGPILAKYGIPATFFLPTGCVSRGEGQWVDRLSSSMRRRSRKVLRLDDPAETFDLDRPDDEREALAVLQSLLMKSTHRERSAYLDDLDDQLRPEGKPPRMIMEWNDVRDLQRLSPGFEIGGHTQDHLDLSAQEGEPAWREISSCAEDLRRELGEAPRHFCYPYERWTPEAKDQVRRAGFRSAVGSGTDYLITSSSDRFALPRIDAPGQRSTFGFVTSGAYPGLSKALTGRA